ncbi:kinesin-like protein Klp10A isoform X1 [Phlebotomus argentipes]|uniref:kinesin-like protein Klp10A isoform X1 n=1 Tax=Phlebotomus argentipes TaxID=94469 RepID=UPI002892C037|nr:kinesin-like protein Klp10A isoform X1 [Phlebotomus argentipes]
MPSWLRKSFEWLKQKKSLKAKKKTQLTNVRVKNDLSPIKKQFRGEKDINIYRDYGKFVADGYFFFKDDAPECRIHSAMVSKVNPVARSVTVEWCEENETKGKEVELDTILSLNADILNDQESRCRMEPPAPVNLSRESSHSSVEDDVFPNEADEEENCAVQQNHGSNSVPTGGTLSIRTPVAGNKSNATQGAIRLGISNNIHERNKRQTRSSSATAHHGQQNGQAEQVENLPPAQQQQSGTRVTRAGGQTTRMSTVSTSVPVPVSSTSTAGSQRLSYVVKEVEKLKENREKRRARQAELKEEKTALMNMDPGNPNWESAAMIREYQSTINFNPIHDGQAIEDHQITVCVRKRPLNKKELAKKELDVITVPVKDQMIVHEPKTKVDLTKFLENHKFRFDYAFDDKCNNELVYKYTAKPLVQTIFEGGMATCFAYGQTGSGKTHTMGGEFNASGKVQDCKNGIYAMAAKDVFNYLKSPRYSHLRLVVSASFFEIYSGKVFDLLANKERLRVLEDGKQQVQVVGLTEKVVDGVDQVLKLIQHGNSARTAGQTAANSNSSRSHAVFQIVLRPPGASKIHGKFSFIDLAGNERGADTSSANRQTRMEGAEINKSLLALKECIRALGKQSAHLPFRVSKLTQVLRDSFIGEKSKTCMIAMISPGLSSCEHTLNTLRYADRVKELVVKDTGAGEMDIVPDENKNGQSNGSNDLAQLRSLSDHDMSVELFNQHAAISDLQHTEELLHEQHRAMIECLENYHGEIQDLFALANTVDYDQDAYCKRGEEIFTKVADISTACKDLMIEFRGKLMKEELISHNVSPNRR